MRFALVLAVLAACGPGDRPPPSGTTPDAPGVTHDGTPAVCFDPAVAGTATHGTPNIQSCAIWNSVASMQGDVTLTRSGNMLTLAFASGPVFTGTVNGSTVMLVYTHLHDFEDGCKWRATETLTGTLDPTS